MLKFKPLTPYEYDALLSCADEGITAYYDNEKRLPDAAHRAWAKLNIWRELICPEHPFNRHNQTEA